MLIVRREMKTDLLILASYAIAFVLVLIGYRALVPYLPAGW